VVFAKTSVFAEIMLSSILKHHLIALFWGNEECCSHGIVGVQIV
jgi:hypothetical protein